MQSNLPIIVIAFFMAMSLAGGVGLVLVGRNRRLESRLQGLSQEGQPGQKPAQQAASGAAIARAVKQALPKMGETLIPEEGEARTKLKTRLMLAGLYRPQAMVVFLGVKMLLMVVPLAVGLIVELVGLMPKGCGLLLCIGGFIFGFIGPSFWLDRKASQRQMMLRRGLPDACDLIVICMEGGLSLSGALKRVVGELRTAHPILADEFNIVQRKVQLGQPLAEALSGFAVRCDLQELKTLASTVKSAEKFGSSMVKALETYSESLRLQRQQKAEEMAQKASTKVLFPTLFFIFPSILVIILGPAAIQLVAVMRNMGK